MFKRTKGNDSSINALDLMEIYSIKVRNHLKLSGSDIVTNLAYYCEEQNGKLSYDDMIQVLGKHYPKAPWLNLSDEKSCIITFLKYSQLYYNHDENFVYFP